MNKLPFVQKGKSGQIRFSSEQKKQSNKTLIIFLFFVFFGFLVLAIRLFQLTIVRGDYYRRLSDNNRIREIVLEAKRGTLIDRKGFKIAESKQQPLDTSHERILAKRTYYDPEAIGSLIGYLQIADTNDFEDDNCLNKLTLGDKTGKKGIEKLFECDLRGEAGKKLVEVDAHGKPINTLTVIPPIEGKTLQLSIDLELQKKAYELVKNKHAAVVVSNPQTGEILALVSAPSFSPQAFEDRNNTLIKQYLSDQGKPLFNRATEGTYPPGSTFKLIVASAALQEKKIKEDTLIEDKGTIKAGPLSFGNWYFLEYGKTEGLVNIVKALKRSNDIFFYKTGELLGPEAIKKWSERFGLGKETGSGLPEADGTIPSPFWKQETLAEQWYLGDTYNFSIGQGYVLTTPIQISRMTAAIAANGKLCKPIFLKDQKPECKSLKLSKETLRLIHEGMRQACTTGGTGWPLFDFSVADPSFVSQPTAKNASSSAHIKKKKISVSCKTGTAESSRQGDTPHAWITAFAPSDKPEIEVTVLVEEAGQGSDIGGPIARDILKAYFERSQ